MVEVGCCWKLGESTLQPLGLAELDQKGGHPLIRLAVLVDLLGGLLQLPD